MKCDAFSLRSHGIFEATGPIRGTNTAPNHDILCKMSALLILVAVLFGNFTIPPPANAQELRMLAHQGQVRKAADPNSTVIVTVPAGTPLRLLKEMPAWYQVDLPPEKNRPAQQGYVALSDAEWVAECGLKSVGKLEPGTIFQDCDVSPRMIVVPAGRFIMGSSPSEAYRRPNEGPQREVTIPVPFAVGVFEVIFDEWENCVRMEGCGGRMPQDEGFGLGQHPALNISWHAARGYIQWLSDLTGKRYRLLTEAEWEYAARAGSVTPNYQTPEDNICEYASVYDKTDDSFHDFDFQFDEIVPCDDGFAGTAPVGSFRPNAFGTVRHDRKRR